MNPITSPRETCEGTNAAGESNPKDEPDNFTTRSEAYTASLRAVKYHLLRLKKKTPARWRVSEGPARTETRREAAPAGLQYQVVRGKVSSMRPAWRYRKATRDDWNKVIAPFIAKGGLGITPPVRRNSRGWFVASIDGRRYFAMNRSDQWYVATFPGL